MACFSELPLWAQILLDGPVESGAHKEPKSTAQKTCLVLLAHGSRDPRWREPFERRYLELRRNYDSVKLAYMEFIGPTLMDVAEECVREGRRNLRILPLFMAAGAHLATDVPNILREIRDRHPELSLEVLAPIGENPWMISLMTEIIQDELQRR